MSKETIKYVGPELIWSIEDVYANAAQLEIEIKSPEDAVEILQNTFEDNESLMQTINDMISEQIEDFYNEQKTRQED